MANEGGRGDYIWYLPIENEESLDDDYFSKIMCLHIQIIATEMMLQYLILYGTCMNF